MYGLVSLGVITCTTFQARKSSNKGGSGIYAEQPSKQLIGEVKPPIPAAPGHPVLQDDEYVRNGVAKIFLEVEPLAGMRNVKITERRTKVDWAQYVREMLDERYPDARKVILQKI